MLRGGTLHSTMFYKLTVQFNVFVVEIIGTGNNQYSANFDAKNCESCTPVMLDQSIRQFSKNELNYVKKERCAMAKKIWIN